MLWWCLAPHQHIRQWFLWCLGFWTEIKGSSYNLSKANSICNINIYSKQTQVGGRKNSVILQKLTPDTAYSITVAAVYRTGEPKDISGQGKTSMNIFSSINPPKVFAIFKETFCFPFIWRSFNGTEISDVWQPELSWFIKLFVLFQNH